MWKIDGYNLFSIFTHLWTTLVGMLPPVCLVCFLVALQPPGTVFLIVHIFHLTLFTCECTYCTYRIHRWTCTLYIPVHTSLRPSCCLFYLPTSGHFCHGPSLLQSLFLLTAWIFLPIDYHHCLVFILVIPSKSLHPCLQNQ